MQQKSKFANLDKIHLSSFIAALSSAQHVTSLWHQPLGSRWRSL